MLLPIDFESSGYSRVKSPFGDFVLQKTISVDETSILIKISPIESATIRWSARVFVDSPDTQLIVSRPYESVQAFEKSVLEIVRVILKESNES